MTSWVEISLKNIWHNYNFFAKRVAPAQVIPVVKGNAYGHGLVPVAKFLADKGVSRLAVVNTLEGLQLRAAGVQRTVVVLSYVDKGELSMAIKAGLELPINDQASFNVLATAASKLKRGVKVHVKVDTGTTRAGSSPHVAMAITKKVTKHKWLRLAGVFSHFADSEENRAYTKKQTARLAVIMARLQKAGITVPCYHFACSAAAVTEPAARFDAIRLGVSLYGLWASPAVKKAVGQGGAWLRPALTWKARIMQVKKVAPKTSIGYGQSYLTKKTQTIALLPVGYYEGYSRALSNKGKVLVGGKKCPIRGRVCMNLIMVDVSAVRGVRAGQEAVLLGSQGTQTVSAEHIAKASGTINYEVVTRINPLLPRLYT